MSATIAAGPKIMCKTKSEGRCIVCHGWITRGMILRTALDGSGKLHAGCLVVDAAAQVLAALHAGPPGCSLEISRRIGVAKTTVNARLRQMLTAGVVKKAGDIYRFNRAFGTVEAAVAAWRERGTTAVG